MLQILFKIILLKLNQYNKPKLVCEKKHLWQSVLSAYVIILTLSCLTVVLAEIMEMFNLYRMICSITMGD